MSIFYKILKHRKFLNKQLKKKTLNKKYILMCHFNDFNGLGFKLLKLFLLKNNFNLKIYKNLFFNFFFNKKKTNSHFIYFKFNNFFNILNLIKLLKKLTIIPFCCFPLVIMNISKNIPLFFNNIQLNKFYLEINQSKLIKHIFINFIKILLLNFIIKLIIKLKKCQL